MATYALCPFYEMEDRGDLLCESGRVRFAGNNDRRIWLKMHCCSWDFKICKFYGELMKKYNMD